MRLGKITDNALKRSILKPLKTEFKKDISAAVGTDCAFSNEKKTFCAIYPVTENVSDCGYYAVIKAVNSLVCQGIAPDQVNLSILLPVDTQEPVLKKIVKDAIEAARECKVTYTGGHTEVTSAVARPLVTATCVGTNMQIAGKRTTKEQSIEAKPDMVIVISKWIALEGTAMIASEKKEELITKYPAPFIDEASGFRDYLTVRQEIEAVTDLSDTSIAAVHDLSNGGVFAALSEIAERLHCGFKVDLKKIPIRQETIEVCEFFEINPYQLLSGGALLFVTSDGEQLVNTLEEKGIPAAVVGYLTDNNDKIITNDDEKRFLELPQTDEIHKVLG